MADRCHPWRHDYRFLRDEPVSKTRVKRLLKCTICKTVTHEFYNPQNKSDRRW